MVKNNELDPKCPLPCPKTNTPYRFVAGIINNNYDMKVPRVFIGPNKRMISANYFVIIACIDLSKELGISYG